MVFIVLGMHKSGTTLISQILHHSGITMGEFDENISYDKGNQYEREETQILNKELLGCGDTYSIMVRNSLNDKLISEEDNNEIKRIVSNLNSKHEVWGFKDPRSCLTYRHWIKNIDNYKVIFVFRNPQELWKHYNTFGKTLKIHFLFERCWHAMQSWYVYNSEMLKLLAEMKKEDYVKIDYSYFMNDDSYFKSMEKLTGMTLEDRRNKKLYRSKSQKSMVYSLTVFALKLYKGMNIKKLHTRLTEV
ncbi:MAG: hypothetical protein SCALA702_33880 [Melioribacteraceae bacterium]|nr:MAG: hypothetical protein SCALA702_33880 [Melioribacteraceae bacterium]